MSHPISWLLAAMATCAAGSGAAAAELPAALRACAAEADAGKRLACYDRQMSEQGVPVAAAPAVPAAPAAAALTPEQRFGYRGEIAKNDAQRQRETNPGVDELRSRIKALAKRGYGEYIITLENGQVWAQRQYDSRFELQTGDEVRIESAALGSFLLVSPRGRSTRVSRVR